LTFSLPAIVELLVKANEPLAVGVDVNEVAAMAASRLQDVAENPDPAVIARGWRVYAKNDRSGGVSSQSLPEGIDRMFDLRSAARA
jgi:hypothetical protein